MTQRKIGDESQSQYKKGLWTVEEDRILMDHVKVHGKGQWNRIAKKTGLKRCGKSCRLRWMNYLSPNVKHGDFTQEEEDLIIRLHKLLGNRWSLIAKRVPGRTDNQVKNYWNTHLSKKLGIVEGQNRKGVVNGDSSSSSRKEKAGNKGPPTNSSHSDLSMEAAVNEGNQRFGESDPVKCLWPFPDEALELRSSNMMDYFNGYYTFDLS